MVRTLLFFAIFHSIATMLAPAVLIHTAVHFSQHVLSGMPPDGRLYGTRGWLPTAIGMALIPLMPLLDHPFEAALEAGFHNVWPPRKGAPSHGGQHSDDEVCHQRDSKMVQEQVSALQPPGMHRRRRTPW